MPTSCCNDRTSSSTASLNHAHDDIAAGIAAGERFQPRKPCDNRRDGINGNAVHLNPMLAYFDDLDCGRWCNVQKVCHTVSYADGASSRIVQTPKKPLASFCTSASISITVKSSSSVMKLKSPDGTNETVARKSTC